jgi:molybdate transport system ATP-binding protein
MMHALIQKQLQGAEGAFMLDVSLEVASGEIVALFGASGAGKTTALRCIAGLDVPENGRITFGDECWFDGTKHVCQSPQVRHVGYMFQDYALFPNMTVRGNLEFALRKSDDPRYIEELLQLMQLAELQHRKPDTLSGGQKQRVALARTLASQPKLLLLDEPLSALDAAIRSQLQDELLRLQRHFGVTTILVSHDVGEVYKLASRVYVIESGRITRQGSPTEVFSQGKTNGKFRFAGEVLAIEAMDVMFALTVLVGNQIVRVTATHEEAAQLKTGDDVMLVSKAFNPMVMRLEAGESPLKQ